MLLTSKYLQDRMGLDIAIEPSLNPTAKRHINLGENTTTLAVVAGTRNLVTKAGKVLPPERLRSLKFFADEFHGCELYTKQVVEPDAGAVAFVKISAGA